MQYDLDELSVSSKNRCAYAEAVFINASLTIYRYDVGAHLSISAFPSHFICLLRVLVMEELSVIVDTPSPETEEKFIREYLVPTVRRLDDRYRFLFWGRYSTSTAVEGGRVKMVFEGDPDEILAEERERLDNVDYIDEWNAEVETDDETRMTEEEQTLVEQISRVTANMNVHYFEEFDDRPPIGRVTEDRFHIRGTWVLLHLLLNQQGYSPEEEVDALFLAIRDRLARIEAEEEYERVEEVVNELHERLDDTSERIKRDFADE